MSGTRGGRTSGTGGDTTIYAVAERAGVSIAMVSRVRSGSPKASPSTRQRVLDAAAALDDVPRGATPGLAARRETAYGLVIGDSTGPYHPQPALGFQAAAAASGCGVVLAVVGDDDAEGAVRRLLARVDGLAVGPSALPAAALAALAALATARARTASAPPRTASASHRPGVAQGGHGQGLPARRAMRLPAPGRRAGPRAHHRAVARGAAAALRPAAREGAA